MPPTGAPGTAPGRTGAPSRPTGSPSIQQQKKAAREAKERWEEWWHFNQWRWARAASARSQVTGGTAGADGNDEGLARFLREVGLADGHYDPKSAAALALGKVQALDAKEALETCLRDASEEKFVRESSALALGLMRASTSGPLLLRIAADRGQELHLRVHALVGLGLLRDPSSVGKILSLYGRNDDVDVHVAAAVALGLIGDSSAAATLARILSNPAVDDSVRAAAATALGKIGLEKVEGRSVVALLTHHLLSDPADNVRRSAALVLHRFTDPSVLTTLDRTARMDQDGVTRSFALISLGEALAARGSLEERRFGRALFEKVVRTGSDREVGFAALALGLLGREDSTCAPGLRTAFEGSKTSSNRAACAIALGLMRDQGSKRLLAELVARGGEDPDLRGYACIALGLMGEGDSEACRYLREIVEKVSIPELKAAAALALSKLGDRKALETLRKSLEDRNRYFQLTAIMAIGYFRDYATVKDLVAHYKRENNPEARAIVIVALGYIGDAGRVVPLLRDISLDFNYLAVFQTAPAMDQVLRLF
ncbi:MAG: HEAT repeat domain-containing protein [Planctomycetales bacterium]|nr:HEAT repeat domain-containing protein [Planctomycetales bacterium]